jgi:aspartyl-tRNA(Asn)/glutamyl-tRNA(Gln) amidotransferase subunit C
VDTTNVEPTSHVLPLTNVLRNDEPTPSLNREAVTALAPAVQPPFVKVPKVIEA